MGDPVTVSLAIGAMGASAYMSGRQQRNALKSEEAQLRTEKKNIETVAAIEQAERMKKLQSVLATQNAIFGMRGQTTGVGTASAIQAESISEANREQRLANIQSDIAKSAYDYNIWSAKKGSRLAMGTSFINTGLDVANKWAQSYLTNQQDFKEIEPKKEGK